MTTYNTGNPLGSTEVKDLYDNAQNLDVFSNGPDSAYPDRFGVSRKSIAGIRKDFANFLLASGYEIIGDYVTNSPLTITRPNQVFSRSGEYYRPGPTLTLPYTTVANWTTDGPKFVSAGDAVLRSALAGTAGSAMVGRPSGTVGTSLDVLEVRSTLVDGPSPISVPPLNAYSGDRSVTPVKAEGSALSQQVWVSPVHIDLGNWDNPTPPALGPIWKFGAPGLVSGPFWSQDSYILRNATIVSGPPQIATWEPWTGNTLTVENNRILNTGAPGEWAFTGKGQNWWPICRGNTWADYQDKRGNFWKFIDDGGAVDSLGASMRYTGNSRCVISENRVKSLGAVAGGIAFYTSAVGTSYTDNACEGMLIGVQLGYPSKLTTIRKLYTELPFGAQSAIVLGDFVAAPNNLISGVVVDGAYANLHSFSNNAFIAIANAQVVVDRLSLNDITLANIPSSPNPLVGLNDLEGQSILVGNILAENVPLIPLTNSHVRIIDTLNSEIKALNGDFAYISNPLVSVSAATWTPLAGNWFQRSTAASSFERATSGATRKAKRQSRYVGISYFQAGTNALCYQLPRANQFEGGTVTCQFLMQSSSPLDSTVVIRIYNPDGSRQTLSSSVVSSINAMKEFTITFFDNLGANSDDSVIAVEINSTAAAAVNVQVTGMRFNRGSFGLCSRADGQTLADTAAQVTGRTWILP